MNARLKRCAMSGVMLLIGLGALLMSLPWSWETALLPRVASIGVIMFGIAQLLSDLRRPDEPTADPDVEVTQVTSAADAEGMTAAAQAAHETDAAGQAIALESEQAPAPAAASGIRAWVVGFLWPIVFLVLTLLIGLPIGSGIATIGWFWRGGPKGWVRAILLGGFVFVVLQFGFNYLLGVPLPTGYIRISFY